jgi:quinol monooxygenase YgiN
VQHWYVYYKVTPHERDALRAQVRQMQERIANATAVRVRLLERTEQGETTTMMEVYEDIDDADGFGRALDAGVRAHLPSSHAAARRVERFRDA